MADIPSVRVVGRLGLTVGDGSDPDEFPDVTWCDEGVVRFTPLNTYVKVAGGSPTPFMAGNTVIDVPIDGDGFLTWQGGKYVWLFDLTSPQFNPMIGDGKATHKVEFRNVKSQGTPVDFPAATVRLAADTVAAITADEAAAYGLSADATVCDLTNLTPVPAAGGTPITRGVAGVGVAALAVADGSLAYTLTDGTEGDAGVLPVGPGGTDAGVAGYVADPDSATIAALKGGFVQKPVAGTPAGYGPVVQADGTVAYAPIAQQALAVPISQQAATSYTLVLADAGTDVETTNALTTNVIIPPHASVAFPVGTIVSVRQVGAGSPVIINGAGVTLRAPNGTKAASQYSTISLIQRAIDEWVVGGDVVPTLAVPLVPTGVTATASVNAVVVSFTPGAGGTAATSYTVTATPGGITATDTASPIAVPGLTAGTAYTFTVHAANAGGNSAESTSSGATPTAPATATIATSGMAAWYQADQISGVADGASCAYWPDNSGAGRGLLQSVAAKQPKMRSTTATVTLPNGSPVLEFDGTQTSMKSPSSGVSAQPFTTFAVVRTTAATGSPHVPLSTGGLAGPYSLSSGNWGLYAGATVAAAGTTTDFNQLTAQFNGASSNVRENGSQLSAGNAGSNNPTSDVITVGADIGGNSAFWTGHIAEVIVYSRALTSAELLAVESYLKTKYGTP